MATLTRSNVLLDMPLPDVAVGGMPVGRPSGRCQHCQSPSGERRFCCTGCEAVYHLLESRGLGRYYELAGASVRPASSEVDDHLHSAWFEQEAQKLQRSSSELTFLTFDIEGIHCSACVWLMEELFRRKATVASTGASGAPTMQGSLTVNPASGTMEGWFPRDFPLVEFVRELEPFGYRVGPKSVRRVPASDNLVWRMGICIALAMNTMMFAVARYLGLRGDGLGKTFIHLEFVLAFGALLVGGSVFIKSAWHGVRRGVLHLDLPIAIGLLLGYAGSTWLLFFGGVEFVFFDTLVVFTTLMLVGRWLRERVVEGNRAAILTDGALQSLLVRTISSDNDRSQIEYVPVSELKVGQHYLIAAHDVVPVRSVLEDDGASFSFAWITGESEVTQVSKGEPVLAGASSREPVTLRLRAEEPFEESRLRAMLKTPIRDDRYQDSRSKLEQTLSKYWVVFVLLSATAGLLLHLPSKGWVGAMSVATAILVITCPCAFGIATPLAYELVMARLRDRGLLIRSPSFLDRAANVVRVVFDKTGTLTESRLTQASVASLSALGPGDRSALYNLAVRSRHPKAKAITDVLSESLDPTMVVTETAGKGVSSTYAGRDVALGSAAWLDPTARGDLVLSVDGETRAVLSSEDALVSGVAESIATLTRGGAEIYIATGDRRDRAMSVANACSIDEKRVLAEASPEGKRAWLEKLGTEGTLFVGDGINDSLAAATAECSGTPTGGRGFLAARTDFYLLREGIEPVVAGLHGANALGRTIRKNLVWAAAYNVIALGLSMAGWMTPLACALLMPASSLISIALVLRALGAKGTEWKSSY